jgi:hypothetical protein
MRGRILAYFEDIGTRMGLDSFGQVIVVAILEMQKIFNNSVTKILLLDSEVECIKNG